ncbi:hypothetical protein VNO78_20216 [Psophocarpus tetragonolobus]|uniref:Uncharacterized protein n=1 Tax=Psophocarpus tetragonolobus TaxID=3891 RepID=A0AAN9XGY8_PSOTE
MATCHHRGSLRKQTTGHSPSCGKLFRWGTVQDILILAKRNQHDKRVKANNIIFSIQIVEEVHTLIDIVIDYKNKEYESLLKTTNIRLWDMEVEELASGSEKKQVGVDLSRSLQGANGLLIANYVLRVLSGEDKGHGDALVHDETPSVGVLEVGGDASIKDVETPIHKPRTSYQLEAIF